jgi:hypothetical protein
MATSVIRTDLPQSALAIQLQLEDLLNMGYSQNISIKLWHIFMVLAFNTKRAIFINWMLCSLAWAFIGLAEEEEPRDKPLFPRADSVAFFKQHANTNLFFIYNTSAGKQLKERLDDIKALEFGLGLVPMHVCEMSAGATNKSFTVVFEASVPWRSARERDRWEFVAFGNDGTLEDFSNFSFRFRGDSAIVLDCYTTNVFQKIKPDVLCIEFIDDDMKSVDRDIALNFRTLFSKYCCPKVYFAISPERGMLIIRIEDENKRVYYPNLLHPYADEMMLRSVLRVFLNKYECREEALQKLTVPEILNLFFYWNSKEFKGELGEDLQEVHTSKRVQNIVGKWLKHEHPWVRQAANYYLITYGDFGSTNVAHEALSDAPVQNEK